MFENGLRRLISSVFVISLISVLKRHFFNNVKCCSAGIISLLAVQRSRWDVMLELDELWLLERWFSILLCSCDIDV